MITAAILLAALVLGAAVQQVLPAPAWLGQAKAPVVLCIVLYYALHHGAAAALSAAALGGLLCDGLEALPLGISALLFLGLAISVRSYRGVIFSTRGATHLAIGLVAGFGLAASMAACLWALGQAPAAAGWGLLALKGLGTALLGMLLLPAICALLGLLDRWTGAAEREPAP